QLVQRAAAMGATAVRFTGAGPETTLSRAPVCPACGTWFAPLEPSRFHTRCSHCDGQGCDLCAGTGLHPEAAAVLWQGLPITAWLTRSVDEARARVDDGALPASGERLRVEIARRLDALAEVGLGYVGLDRTAPTLSRGEAQRVRVAVALVSRLEDMLHVLDEPTVGQHPRDVARLMPALRELKGPVVYVEHDRAAAAAADGAIDIGPGAGPHGGEVTFAGTPAGLWASDTATGRTFSMRERVATPALRPPATTFMTIRGAHLRTLRNIDVPIPLGRLTVVTGVSGSGKSTLVEDVLVASLEGGEPAGCETIDGPRLRVTLVSQDPLGPNARSNPATYTKLSDLIRDLYARLTNLSPSHFSFNRPEGACPTCKGLGALEVRMSHLPSTWIPCPDCDGVRFSEEVLAATIPLAGRPHSIAGLYALTIDEAAPLLLEHRALTENARRTARGLLSALQTVGLGYLALGQPSPTLSGGEAQRVKLARYLGRQRLEGQLLILDEPSTGLHPQDISGLLRVLDRLVRHGATVVVVEHNTDVMRAADWIVDLGPGAGPDGGALLYAGPVDGLLAVDASPTAQALREEAAIVPEACTERIQTRAPAEPAASPAIRIRGARAHNLRSVDVDIPRGRLTVVTGVSGSGKSSLVHDVLEAEARRRYLESLSMYERQGTREGPEAEVDEINGLGVALTVQSERPRFASPRATVGSATEIWHHLSVLLALLGERPCPSCGAPARGTGSLAPLAEPVRCAVCGAVLPTLQPRHFNPRVYGAACTTCHGLGALQEPRPDKLIIHPERPLCDGAMYSPGFFPGGYLCKPFNGGYDMVQALARKHGFDPAATPWCAMSPEAQHAFLYGDPEPLTVQYVSRTGRGRTTVQTFPGFYGWIRDWDVGGTYTESVPCQACGGSGLRPQYAGVTLQGHAARALQALPLAELTRLLEQVTVPSATGSASGAGGSLLTVQRRLGFLCDVGLGYLNLQRMTRTLSAGEAQRVQLAGLLGSGLGSLTIL
ncbi:MAG: excinuclease ABC subunit UvrA, partial [Anaerolineae bacterium]